MDNKVSIIIPKYKPKKETFLKLKKYLKENAKGMEIIEIEGKNGLANTYNQGIKKAKGEIIITLHQDCIPKDKESIFKLIEPFNDENVILTYCFIRDNDKNKKYRPFPPDGKFVAYRKSILEEVGLFNCKIFFTGGEDVELYSRLKNKGKIVFVNTEVEHFHKGYKYNLTKEKRKQNGNINGCLFRVIGFKNDRWLKALILSFVFPFSYGKEFIKGFLSGKQNYRRKK